MLFRPRSHSKSRLTNDCIYVWLARRAAEKAALAFHHHSEVRERGTNQYIARTTGVKMIKNVARKTPMRVMPVSVGISRGTCAMATTSHPSIQPAIHGSKKVTRNFFKDAALTKENELALGQLISRFQVKNTYPFLATAAR